MRRAALIAGLLNAGLMIASAICVVSLACAQNLDDSRCDWTDCSRDDSFKAQFYPPQNESRQLAACDRDDELACTEECRTKFDNEFHLCKRDCLDKHCIRNNPRVATGTAGESRREKSGCVEIQSIPCQEQCKNSHEKSNNSLETQQCRRQCLTEKCPNASPLDIANEGRSPGSLRCSRCKEDNKVSCQRNCLLGSISFPHPGVALEQLGCEKLCAITSCDEECGGSLGF